MSLLAVTTLVAGNNSVILCSVLPVVASTTCKMSESPPAMRASIEVTSNFVAYNLMSHPQTPLLSILLLCLD